MKRRVAKKIGNPLNRAQYRIPTMDQALLCLWRDRRKYQRAPGGGFYMSWRNEAILRLLRVAIDALVERASYPQRGYLGIFPLGDGSGRTRNWTGATAARRTPCS